MPEGHSVHRIARQFDRNFVGRQVVASSPQGRFAEGASLLSGREATAVKAGIDIKALLAWAAVGMPLAWGIWITLEKALVLFK